MKILMVNKFYFIKGGSETYYFALKRLLEEQGHVVVDFSMKDDRNFESSYSEYFVENVDYDKTHGLIDKLRIALKIIYSFEAKKKFEEIVRHEKPDLIHLHIFQHQLSPSILDVIKKYRIPTVYTAHDLKMICLNYKMMHHGHVCEECMGGKYYRCICNQCVKGSSLKSAINVMEGYLHKWRKSYSVIDKIITPSEFYKEKFEQFGVESERVVHIPNFLYRDKPQVNERCDSKKYYLYFGRLSEEKGILTLIKAFEKCNSPLYIVGTGPLKKQIEEYISDINARNITALGFKKDQELIDLIGNARAVVLPSEWYENGPYSAIEALQLGRPIIGANIGGIPELVNGNGFLYESGDVEELYEIINSFENMEEEQYSCLEIKSIQLYEAKYTWRTHLQKVSDVYAQALDIKSKM